MTEDTAARNKRLIESYLKTGDISGLSASDKLHLYTAQCARMKLDPMTRPLETLYLNGKEILYVRSNATDMLAVLHCVTRETTVSPTVRDYAGTKLLFCEVRCTLPSGRSETEVATLAINPKTIINDVMKVSTKAKRRGTLSITGAGMMDSSEFETIPGYTLDGDTVRTLNPGTLAIHTERCLASPAIQNRTEGAREEFNAIAKAYATDAGIHIDDARKTLGAAVMKARREDFPKATDKCPVCGETRYITPSGEVCKNGHGG